MSESVIICAIICITIVVVIWIGSSFLSLLSRIMKGDIEQKSEDVSDNIKYMMCGEALQSGICNQMCYRCAWNVKNRNLIRDNFRYSDYLKEDKNGRSEEQNTEG